MLSRRAATGDPVRFGIYTPNFGDYSDPRRLAALASEAEAAGWEGFFLYDHIGRDGYGMRPGDGVVDPWIALTAIASATERIRLGPLVTAVARRRPWKLAHEVTSLDHLSGGRVIFGAGLGGPSAFDAFGEDPNARVRAEKLDEGLEIMTALWRGEPLRHDGAHFHLDVEPFLPRPLQTPRVPIWVAGIWPNRPPFRRAARWDGAFPLTDRNPLPTPKQIRDIVSYVEAHRVATAPFDLVVGGRTLSEDPRDCERPAQSAQAGATWWLEWLEPDRGSFEENRARVLRGPPRIAAG